MILTITWGPVRERIFWIAAIAVKKGAPPPQKLQWTAMNCNVRFYTTGISGRTGHAAALAALVVSG
jgi:hypothetical protein